MTRLFRLLLVLLALPASAADLESAFRDPAAAPREARPMTWWHWMNGNVTREGITADLESMKRVGLAGAQIFIVDGGVPAGPVEVMTPQWRELVKHAASECARLGLELGIHNCPGWSSSGGPWNTPENSMQEVVTAEQAVRGPATFDAALPMPHVKQGYYRDVAVLAFRTPAGETPRMSDASPKIRLSKAPTGVSVPKPNPQDPERQWLALASPSAAEPQFIEISFDKPFAARMLRYWFGRGMEGGHVRIEVSDDGEKFRVVRTFNMPRSGREDAQVTCVFPPQSARFYRIVFTSVRPATARQIRIGDLELSNRVSTDNLAGKAFYIRSGDYSTESKAAARPEDMIARDGIIDLSDRLNGGRLRWEVAEGEWTILRVGHSSNGVLNHPAPAGGLGLECDKLSAESVDAHWNGMMAKLIEDAGPLVGKAFNNVELDSYEVGTQNWTANFRAEFKQRRGYDLLRYLPVFSGRVVDSPDVTERFLWDVRRTVADLFAEKYVARMAELAHKAGMKLMVEPYGNAPGDDLQFAGPADVPLSEFWLVKGLDGCSKLASSAGHTYGRNVIGAEAFTAGELGGNKWNTDFFDLKVLGDLIFTAGVNRFIFHTYTHQPWLDRPPGMTMGATGTHFGRTTTWWEQSTAWIDYLTRCQLMLQRGQFVADVLYYAGEDVPCSMYGGHVRDIGLPAGYDYDAISAEALLTRVSVRDGRLVLPDGMSYRVLMLARKPTMSLPILRKLKELADAGALIIGPRPTVTPGLSDFPQSEDELRKTVDSLWSDKLEPQHIADASISDALSAIKPDFEPAGKDSGLVYIHRRDRDADIYFISSQRKEARQVNCTFRVAGKLPELWAPDTGAIAPASGYSEKDGRTLVPLNFDPSSSVFVVFRRSAEGGPGSGDVAMAEKVFDPVPVSGPWRITFLPKLGAPSEITIDKLISWTDHAETGVKYFSGTATYTRSIDIPSDRLAPGKVLYLDLGQVKNVAEVKLNGRPLGIVWKPPFRIDITSEARAGANDLEVKITNLWPNRLIGDEQLPPDCKWRGTALAEWPQWLLDGKPSPTGRITFTTRHHYTKDSALLPSGLLGPVTLQCAHKTSLREKE